jgi:ferredoxin--NADP+ reductase
MADWQEGRVARQRAWNATHYSLEIDCDLEPFTAGQFVRVGLDIEGERVVRPYSCVNAPHQRGVEILYNIVPEGPLTNRLAQLREGDRVWVGPSATGFLTLSQVPQNVRDLWLLATGTGIGPFLSILQTEEPWQRFERIVLAYGVRETVNLTYPHLLEELQQQYPDTLRIVPCITSRDPGVGYFGRITEALRDGQLEVLAEQEINREHSHVMLCGHQGMIKEVTEQLGDRGLKRHLRHDPGQISSEKYH